MPASRLAQGLVPGARNAHSLGPELRACHSCQMTHRLTLRVMCGCRFSSAVYPGELGFLDSALRSCHQVRLPRSPAFTCHVIKGPQAGLLCCRLTHVLTSTLQTLSCVQY